MGCCTSSSSVQNKNKKPISIPRIPIELCRRPVVLPPE